MTKGNERAVYLNRIRNLTFFIEDSKIRPWVQKASLYIRQEKYFEAIDLLNRASNYVKNNVKILLELSKAYKRNGDIKTALYYLEMAKRINPVDSKILGALKTVYKELGLLNKLINILDEIIVIYGENEYMLFEKSFTYMRMNKIDFAYSEFLKIPEKYPDFPLTYFRLGQLELFYKNNKEKAKFYFKEYKKKIKNKKYIKILKIYFPIKKYNEKIKRWEKGLK